MMQNNTMLLHTTQLTMIVYFHSIIYSIVKIYTASKLSVPDNIEKKKEKNFQPILTETETLLPKQMSRTGF